MWLHAIYHSNFIGVWVGAWLGNRNGEFAIFSLSHRKIFGKFLCNGCSRDSAIHLIVYFGVPSLIKVNLSPLVAGLVALTLNSAAYLAENVRGGINALPTQQWEAAKVLGYRGSQIFWHILYPQAFKNILPSLTNEFVSLIKESSILMVVGVPELTKVTKDIVARELNPMEMYLICAGLYLVMTSAFSYFARLTEKKSA